MKTLMLALLLTVTVSASAQESLLKKVLLAPVRELKRTAVDMVTFRDKKFAVVAWTYVAAYAADVISTHQWVEECKTCVERGIFFTGSRSTPKIALSWGGLAAANLAASHALKAKKAAVSSVAWPIGPLFQATNHAVVVSNNERFLNLHK